MVWRSFIVMLISLLLFSCEEKNEIILVTDEVVGVEVGDDVTLMGVKAGKIDHFEFSKNNDFVAIHVALNDGVEIPENTYALLKTNVLGEGRLTILPIDSGVSVKKYGADTIAIMNFDFKQNMIEHFVEQLDAEVDSNSLKMKNIEVEHQKDSSGHTFTIKLKTKKDQM